MPTAKPLMSLQADTAAAALTPQPVIRGDYVDIPKGWVPPAPDFSDAPSKNVPEDDYPSNDAVAAKLRAGSGVSFYEVQKQPKTVADAKKPMTALNERPGAKTPLGSLKEVLDMADSPLREGGVNALENGQAGGAAAVSVVDLLVAAQSATVMNEMRGKRVEVIGQVLPADGTNFRLLRLLVLCCAADAQPLAVRIEGNTKPTMPSMGWAKVTGKLTFVKKTNGSVPVVIAEKVKPIERPDEPFLY
jgi:uncharacterized repeat protein (TIGR03943 family)